MGVAFADDKDTINGVPKTRGIACSKARGQANRTRQCNEGRRIIVTIATLQLKEEIISHIGYILWRL